MQLDNRQEIKEKIEKIYKEFREIYTEDHYPEWFNFCDKFNKNKGYGEDGFIDGKLGHELRHYAILQTPLYEEREIIIVGNNNTWFIPNKYKMKESLEIVKGLKKAIPKENFVTKKQSAYSKSLSSYFQVLGEDSKKLFERAIGINRLWIQTGSKCPPYYGKKEKDKCAITEEMKSNPKFKKEWNNLVRRCEEWTMEIIEIINPKLLLLLSGPAQKLYLEGRHDRGFWVQHSYAPSYTHPTYDLESGIKSRNNTERKKILDIWNGLYEAGLLND